MPGEYRSQRAPQRRLTAEEEIARAKAMAEAYRR